MRAFRLFQLAAVGCILSAILLVISNAMRSSSFGITLNLLAGVFHATVLPAVYLRQRRESGALGAIGFITHALGLSLLLGAVFSAAFVFPVFDVTASDIVSGPDAGPFILSTVLFVLGVVLFSVASFRAKVFPRAAAVLYGSGYFMTLFATVVPGFVLVLAALIAGAGLFWFGISLWSETSLAGAPQHST